MIGKLFCLFNFHLKGEAIVHQVTSEQVSYGVAIGATRILSKLTYRCARCGVEYGHRGVIFLRDGKFIEGRIDT